MTTFKQFLESKFSPNTWVHLLPNDKEEYHKDLIDLVDKAYGHTTLGSFVKSLLDVKGSDWEVLSQDAENIKDAIFFRKPRSSESWVGHKIQGIGHDNTSEGKKIVLSKLVDQLAVPGWWIEASDPLASALLRRGVQPVTDEKVLKRLFPSIEKVKEDGSYIRQVNGGRSAEEFVFGHPKISK
jgi:hypothetical protein